MKIFGDFEVGDNEDEELDDEPKYAICVPWHPIEFLIEQILISSNISLSHEIQFLLDLCGFQILVTKTIVEKPHFYDKAVECFRKLNEKHLRERHNDLTDFRYFETQYAEAYFSINFRNFAEDSEECLIGEDESSPMHVKFLLSNIIDSDDSTIQRYVDLLQYNEVLSIYLIEACENVIANSELLMEYSHISRLQFFALIKFIGRLYNSNLMEFEKIRAIFNQLENQNQDEILKHLSFLILEKSKSEADEDFKTNVRNYIKNVTAASIFIDEIYDGYSQPLINATIINTFGLSTFTKTLIQKAYELNKIDTHFHLISMRLYEIYENFSEILFTQFKKELQNAFNVPVGHDIDWKMIEKLGKMIYFAYEKDILEDDGACMIEFFNKMIIHADLKGFKIFTDIFICVFDMLKIRNREALFNYLEYFYDIMRDDVSKELKEILNPILEKFDEQLFEFDEKCVAANPRFKRFVEELTRPENVDIQALKIPNTKTLIKDAKLCAQYFFAFATKFVFNETKLTGAVTLWKSQNQDDERAKFIPTLIDICMATFKNQHMAQNGYKNRRKTIATSCFISELFKMEVIDIEKYEEFLVIVTNSVATDANNLNIKCFHHMVSMIEDYLYQSNISPEMKELTCELNSMLSELTKSSFMNFMLRGADELDITTHFDDYLKKLEGCPFAFFFDWNFMAMKEMFTSADKIIMSVKKFKHENFIHLLKIINEVSLLWSGVCERLAGKILEQISFETHIKLQENYDWSALKNLSIFAAFLCENQIFEFDFTLDLIIKAIFENVRKYESKFDNAEYSNEAKKVKYDESKKFEFRKKYTMILHQVIKKCTRVKELKKLENFYEVLETQSNEYDEMLRAAVQNISKMFKKSPNNEYDLIDAVTTGVDEMIIEDPEDGVRRLFNFVIFFPITKVNKFRKTIELEDDYHEFFYWVFEDATHEVFKKAWTSDQYQPREIAGAARLLNELYKKNKITTEIFSECLKIIIERCSENPSNLDLICLLYAGSQSLHLMTQRDDIDQKIIKDVKETAYKYRERMTNLFTNYAMGTDDDFDHLKSDKKS